MAKCNAKGGLNGAVKCCAKHAAKQERKHPGAGPGTMRKCMAQAGFSTSFGGVKRRRRSRRHGRR